MEIESFLGMFQSCFGYWTNEDSLTTLLKEPNQPTVTLDTFKMGNDVVIVKNGHRICGSGAALATAPIHQDKAYFEVKVQQGSPEFGVGLASNKVDLNHVPLGMDHCSWVLRGDGGIFHNNEQLFQLPNGQRVQEGDVIGIAFDHLSLRFLINNSEIGFAVSGLRQGDDTGLFPALYVDDGAILDAAFDSFLFEPPVGYSRIMIEQSLL